MAAAALVFRSVINNPYICSFFAGPRGLVVLMSVNPVVARVCITKGAWSFVGRLDHAPRGMVLFIGLVLGFPLFRVGLVCLFVSFWILQFYLLYFLVVVLLCS